MSNGNQDIDSGVWGTAILVLGVLPKSFAPIEYCMTRVPTARANLAALMWTRAVIDDSTLPGLPLPHT